MKDSAMGILEAIALASAASKFLQTAIPAIRDAIQGGELSPEDEAKARAEYKLLRESNHEFSGPLYELSGR